MAAARRRTRPEPRPRNTRVTPSRAVAVLVAATATAAATALVMLLVATSGSGTGAGDAPARAAHVATVPAVHEVPDRMPPGSTGAQPAVQEVLYPAGPPPSSPADPGATAPPATLATPPTTAATEPPPVPGPGAPDPTVPAPTPETTPPAEGPEAGAVAAGSVWDDLAACESGGDWSTNTGNGYYGGLQFSATSWSAVGGTGLPHEHPREVQIAVAERLLDSQGWGAWPSCSSQLGLR